MIFQTRNYITSNRDIHGPHGHTISEGAPDHHLATLFVTERGIQALVGFMRYEEESRAFRMPKTLKDPL